MLKTLLTTHWQKQQAGRCCASKGLLSTGGPGPSAAPLFQVLWAGLDIRANGTIRLRDEELASLRPARRILRILEVEVPKTPAEIEQHLRYYSLTDSPLSPTEFDRLLFTSVYSAYQVRSVQGLDKNPWIGFFSQLVDEIFRDLCKGFCPDKTVKCMSPFPDSFPKHAVLKGAVLFRCLIYLDH
uniref:Family with sequence similarity 180 member B n=1 Tax=Ficedula albicollis TaxID=59894 RepID=U3KIG8_FICAL